MRLKVPGEVLAGHRKPNVRPRVVATYFAGWDVYGRQYFVKDIPGDKINTILYAFGKPAADGTCQVIDPWADYQMVYWSGTNAVDGVVDNFGNNGGLYGNFNQLKKFKALHPNVKILISLGGWSASTYFSDVAATPASRAAFAQSCIDTFIKGNLPTGGWPTDAGGIGVAKGIFDGIDVDWERPGKDPGNGAHFSSADKHNATLLFQELRKQLDAQGKVDGKHYLLTAALPAGDVNSTGSYELKAVSKILDWACVMTYDFHSASDAYTAFNSPFGLDRADPAATDKTWNTLGTVAHYRENGFAPGKIAIGVPFYANQYIRTGTANHGLYQPFDNTGLDVNTLQWDTTPTPTYRDLVDISGIVTPNGQGQNGYTRFWGRETGEPWLFNPAGSHALASGTITAPTFISYDDPASISERVDLVKDLGLRGIFSWEISQDSNDHALANAMGKGLLHEKHH